MLVLLEKFKHEVKTHLLPELSILACGPSLQSEARRSLPLLHLDGGWGLPAGLCTNAASRLGHLLTAKLQRFFSFLHYLPDMPGWALDHRVYRA